MTDVRIEVSGNVKHTLDFTLDGVRRWRPAYRRGHPDDWEPAEGAEWDVIECRLIRGTKERVLPRKMAEAFGSMYAERINKALDL